MFNLCDARVQCDLEHGLKLLFFESQKGSFVLLITSLVQAASSLSHSGLAMDLLSRTLAVNIALVGCDDIPPLPIHQP